MTSSGGGDDALNSFLAMQQSQPATPIPDLPVAGKNNVTGDPYEYGKFQNFLPEVKAEGRNESATGLRPEMFYYNKPTGVTNPRDELAKTIAAPPAPASTKNPQWVQMRSQMSPQDLQIFQSKVSPEEFKAFMSATP